MITIPLLLAALEGSSLIGLLIWLLVLAVVVYVIFLILNMIPIPEPIKTIILCILGLVLLLVIVQRLGFFLAMIDTLVTVFLWWLLWLAGATTAMGIVFAFGQMFAGDDDE